jgi:superfamily II DNA/RNA helicase
MGKRSKSRMAKRAKHQAEKIIASPSPSPPQPPSQQQQQQQQQQEDESGSCADPLPPVHKKQHKEESDEKQSPSQRLATPSHKNRANAMATSSSGPLTYSSGLHVSYQCSGTNQHSHNNNDKAAAQRVPPPLDLLDLNSSSSSLGRNIVNETNVILADLCKVWKYLGNSNRHKKKRKRHPDIDKGDNDDDDEHEVEGWLPTPIQRQSWSILLNHRSLIGIAPTSSGKTLAYAIPTLLLAVSSSTSSSSASSESILVLLPTRELCHQVAKVYTFLAKAMTKTGCGAGSAKSPPRVRVVPIHGGVDRHVQRKALVFKGTHPSSLSEVVVVVATPGRFLDLLDERVDVDVVDDDDDSKMKNDFVNDDNNDRTDSESSVPKYAVVGCVQSPRWIVLDEADQLTKEGDLGPQVDRILAHVRRRNDYQRVSENNKNDDNNNNNNNNNNNRHGNNNNNNNNNNNIHGNNTILPATLALVSATYPEKCHAKFREWMNVDHIVVQVDSLHKQTTTGQPPPPHDGITKAAREGLDFSSQDPLFDATKNPNEDDATAANALENMAETATTRRDDSSAYSRIPAHLTQVVHVCAEHKKARKLIHILQTVRQELCQSDGNHKASRSGRNDTNGGSAATAAGKSRNQQHLGIIFFGKIDKLKYVTKLLQKEQVNCVELHSQLPRHVRERNLATFSSGQTPLIMATDLAARGIDIPHVRFVVQYDFPGNLDQYIHRCGRAGRRSGLHGGGSGTSSGGTGSSAGLPPLCKVYSFFTRNLKPMAADLVHLLEANNAWVDPNLRLLVNGYKGNISSNKTKTNDNVTQIGSTASKQNKKENRAEPGENLPSSKSGGKQIVASQLEDQDFSDEDDEFADLSPKRIVLKRASHVSDASSCSDESSNEEDD